jgi:hypothetical protein
MNLNPFTFARRRRVTLQESFDKGYELGRGHASDRAEYIARVEAVPQSGPLPQSLQKIEEESGALAAKAKAMTERARLLEERRVAILNRAIESSREAADLSLANIANYEEQLRRPPVQLFAAGAEQGEL